MKVEEFDEYHTPKLGLVIAHGRRHATIANMLPKVSSTHCEWYFFLATKRAHTGDEMRTFSRRR